MYTQDMHLKVYNIGVVDGEEYMIHLLQKRIILCIIKQDNKQDNKQDKEAFP